MATRKGVYNSFLQGVSQQTPQEREDGQLGAQTNMLSDIVGGLRRRSGVKYHSKLSNIPATSYIKLVELTGTTYVIAVDTVLGKVSVMDFLTGEVIEFTDAYFVATSKASIKSTVSRDNLFILNTEKVPNKVALPETGKNPNRYGYFSIRSSQFSKFFDFDIRHPSIPDKHIGFKTADTTADQATPEWVATELVNRITSDVDLNALLNVTRVGSTVALEVKSTSDTGLLICESSTGSAYVYASGASRIINKAELLGTLPVALDGYTIAVGNAGNSSYYKYSDATKTWSEVGVWESPHTVTNMPKYISIISDVLTLGSLDLQPRVAGDDDNNPYPKFVGYGITGIGSYQSRLVLLSGAYVNLSKTTEFDQFMRTTVEEILDDDAIEVSSASLSSAQFEYCLPYNKDLILISQTHQAVIPANATVLTPKTAVIYPSTRVELSLACEPQVVSRSLYYTYQRGSDYYQVGEFIPNSYTDAQYYNQNLTDHIPLYATGVCTNMAASTTSNMVVCSSDTNKLLINQFYWQGDERAQMAFHEWVYPYDVVYTAFLQEYLVLFMVSGDDLIIGTQNVQLNQLNDKPVPYLDLYDYVTITDKVGTLPTHLQGVDGLVATIYDNLDMRHKEIAITYDDPSTIRCAYNGVLALGRRYVSSYTLTPPFVKDQNGKVVGDASTTIVSLTMTFKNTGTFDVSTKDTIGTAYTGEHNTAYTWSEAQLGFSWVNSIGEVVIPCRTKLSSTDCTVTTDSTTDLNLVSTSYLIRLNLRQRSI